MLLEGVWLNLQFDILSFVTSCFADVVFKQIDGIVISGALLLRRVATYKAEIPDSFQYVIEKEFGEQAALGYEQCVVLKLVEPVEPKLDFAHGIDHLNQIVSHDRLVYFGFIFEQAGMLSKEKAVVAKPQVAFGVR
jgi:hypothetical protein